MDRKNENTPIDIKVVQHSGNLGLEFPVRDFDKTSLEEAAEQYITIPDSVEGVTDTLTTETDSPSVASGPAKRESLSQEVSSNPIRRFLSTTHGKIITGLAGTSLVSGAVVGVAHSVNSAPVPKPVETVLPTPDASPSLEPTTQPEVTPAPETIPAELQQYKDMPLEAFEQLSKAEQALYVSYLFRNIDTFVQDWVNQKAQPTDIYTPASESDTPQQALANSIWMYRYTLSLDELDAKKAMSMILLSTDTRDYQEFMELIEKSSGSNPRALAEANFLPIGTVQNAEELSLGSVGSYPGYRDVSFDYEGNPVYEDTGSFKGDFYFGSFPGYDGKTFSYWG